MSGGGDTPTKTLWIIGIADGFVFGQFQDGKVFIGGPSEGKRYITDLDGRILAIVDYAPGDDPYLEEMLAQYFGEIESVGVLIVSDLAIGDDVPNWEEYKLLSK